RGVGWLCARDRLCLRHNTRRRSHLWWLGLGRLAAGRQQTAGGAEHEAAVHRTHGRTIVLYGVAAGSDEAAGSVVYLAAAMTNRRTMLSASAVPLLFPLLSC